MPRRKPKLPVPPQSILDDAVTLRVKRASKVLDVPERTVWLLIKQGKLKVSRPTSKLTLIHATSIREFLGV